MKLKFLTTFLTAACAYGVLGSPTCQAVQVINDSGVGLKSVVIYLRHDDSAREPFTASSADSPPIASTSLRTMLYGCPGSHNIAEAGASAPLSIEINPAGIAKILHWLDNPEHPYERYPYSLLVVYALDKSNPDSPEDPGRSFSARGGSWGAPQYTEMNYTFDFPLRNRDDIARVNDMRLAIGSRSATLDGEEGTVAR